MRAISKIGLTTALLGRVLLPSPSSADDAEVTGEILTLLYVRDVRESVTFYRAIGFDHDYFYDYREDEYVIDWRRSYPPEYAEVTSGSIRVALTTVDDPESATYGGGVRHYFLVEEVEERYERIKAAGIVPEPDEVERRPWMDFITLTDPDGHQIVFGRKNETYYERARAEIERLRCSAASPAG